VERLLARSAIELGISKIPRRENSASARVDERHASASARTCLAKSGLQRRHEEGERATRRLEFIETLRRIRMYRMRPCLELLSYSYLVALSLSLSFRCYYRVKEKRAKQATKAALRILCRVSVARFFCHPNSS